MGRPPLRRDAKVKKRTIWMHDDQVARVIARVGSQGMSEFIRQAVDAKLEAEPDEEPAPVPPIARGPPPRPTRLPEIEGFDDLLDDEIPGFQPRAPLKPKTGD